MLLGLLLLSAATASPPLVYGGARAPEAWAVLSRGNLWVCWHQAADCWQRVPLELRRQATAPDLDLDLDLDLDEPTPERGMEVRRLGFPDPTRLVWLDGDGRSWVVRQGDLQPRVNEDRLATAAASRPRAHTCSPTGWLPILRGQRFDWIEAGCAGLTRCYRPALELPQPRLPALGVSIGVEVRRTSVIRVSPHTEVEQRAEAWLVTAFVGLRFDVAAARRHRMTWESLMLAARREAALPAIPSGPLAQRHRRALTQRLCQGGAA